MSIRQGVYLIGQTAEVGGSFDAAEGVTISGVSLIVKKPDGTSATFPLTPVANAVSMDITTDMPGKWLVRLQCTGPTPSAVEGSFLVVPSAVLS
jgi:hypothetical protein